FNALAFSPDGEFLAARTSENIVVWNTSRWQEVSRTANGPFAFSRKGRILATSTRDGITFWKTDTWQKTATIKGGLPPSHLDISPDGRTLAALAGNQIELWDIETRTRTSATNLVS